MSRICTLNLRDAVHSTDYAIAVCLSVKRRYCVKTAKRPQTFFTVANHTVLAFFYTKCHGNIPTLNTGSYKKHNFRPLYRFISEMIQDRAIITMECKYEIVSKLSNDTIFNHLR